jgi:hypothetical protein
VALEIPKRALSFVTLIVEPAGSRQRIVNVSLRTTYCFVLCRVQS